MKTTSSNINESGTLKSEKAYYKDGKFWFVEGDKWPVRPNESDLDHDIYSKKYIEERIEDYEQTLTSALKEAVEFEDQTQIKVWACAIVNPNLAANNWQPDEGLYTIPEQRVEIVEVPEEDPGIDSSGPPYAKVDFKKVARLVPSSLEKQEKPLREHFEVETDAGDTLRTFDYIKALEAYIERLENSPLHREDQEELWKELGELVKNNQWFAGDLYNYMRKRFTITRK
jgi:hypothetical protein